MIETLKPMLDFFSVIGAIAGATVSIGMIYVWIKKPVAVFDKLNNGAKTANENKTRLDTLEPTMEIMAKNIQSLVDHQKESDRARLRFHIVDFLNDLKAGEKKSEVQFEYILEEAKQYKELEGNGLVPGYVKEIKEAHSKKNKV